ncbi:MAG: RNA polymerase sigma factor [Cyclobacteriaceae bacterium]
MFVNPSSKHESIQDMELIQKYLESDNLDFLGTLYQRYMHLVLGVCLKYFKDREESKDAVMQIFEKLILAVKKHEVTNFKGWISVVARNHCLMELRSKKHKINRQRLEINEHHGVEISYQMHPDDGEELDLKIGKIEAALINLPEEQQICIKLFYLEEKSYKTVAEETGYDLKKVKSYIQNGKRNLRIQLEKENG